MHQIRSIAKLEFVKRDRDDKNQSDKIYDDMMEGIHHMIYNPNFILVTRIIVSKVLMFERDKGRKS